MKFYTNNFIEYIYKEIKLLLVTVNNRLKLENEIVHDLSCHPIFAAATCPFLDTLLLQIAELYLFAQ